jgi:hypothetical protein
MPNRLVKSCSTPPLDLSVLPKLNSQLCLLKSMYQNPLHAQDLRGSGPPLGSLRPLCFPIIWLLTTPQWEAIAQGFSRAPNVFLSTTSIGHESPFAVSRTDLVNATCSSVVSAITASRGRQSIDLPPEPSRCGTYEREKRIRLKRQDSGIQTKRQS